MSHNIAHEDLRDKLRLEVQFRSEMDAYFNKVVETYIIRLRTRLPFNVDQLFHEDLVLILRNQYNRVEVPFSNRIRRTLPREVQSTVREDQEITSTLKQFNLVRSEIQATNINRTTQKNVFESMEIAESFNTETDILKDGVVIREKRFLVGFELILTAGRILRRKLKGRTATIVTGETQTPAEVAKLTEAEVLVGLQPSILGGDQRQVPVTKIWVSMGDSIVRSTHLDADGQERPFNKPFSVGGFPLKVPGDTSLGAPMTEIAGCRCAAEFNSGEVAALRFDKLREEQFIVRG